MKFPNLGVGHFRDVTERIEEQVFTPQMRLLDKGLSVALGLRLGKECEIALRRIFDLFDETHPAAMLWATYQTMIYLVSCMPTETQKLVLGEEIRFDDELIDDAARFFKEQMKGE